MPLVAFLNRTDFDRWHAPVNTARGYPMSRRGRTATTAYTTMRDHPTLTLKLAVVNEFMPPTNPLVADEQSDIGRINLRLATGPVRVTYGQAEALGFVFVSRRAGEQRRTR